jgi:hypothetical protein
VRQISGHVCVVQGASGKLPGTHGGSWQGREGSREAPQTDRDATILCRGIGVRVRVSRIRVLASRQMVSPTGCEDSRKCLGSRVFACGWVLQMQCMYFRCCAGVKMLHTLL